MPSSFLICYPDVPSSALVVTPTQTHDPDFDVSNHFYGKRHNYSKLASTSFAYTVTYDLGTGNSRTIDHFIIGGAQILLAQGVIGAVVSGSNDGTTFTNQLGTFTNLSTRTFNGPDGDDVIFTQAYNDQIAGSLTAYRYFRVNITAGFLVTFPLSKIYIGASFDMGVEPSTYDMTVVTDNDSDTWRYSRGHVVMAKAYHPIHRVTVEWDGVTDAKATEFMASIMSNPYRHSVFLYAATYADPLYDNKLMYCKVVDSECSVTKLDQDFNNIVAVFEESI